MTTLMTGPENNEQACDAIVTDKAQLENNPQAYPTPSNLYVRIPRCSFNNGFLGRTLEAYTEPGENL